MSINIENKNVFIDHIVSCYPQEGCGYVKDDLFIPVENVHPEPTNNFLFPTSTSIIIADKPYPIIHSHTFDEFTQNPCTPSEEDMKGQQSTNVPWGIVHCDGESVSNIVWFGIPLDIEYIGRKYITNAQDCFTLARDFYFKEFNIDFGSHPRPADWEKWNPHYIEQNYKDLGFIDINDLTNLQYGDIILYRIASNYANHIGIYTKENTFIHHLYNRKSCEDSISKWHRQFYKVLRYQNG